MESDGPMRRFLPVILLLLGAIVLGLLSQNRALKKHLPPGLEDSLKSPSPQSASSSASPSPTPTADVTAQFQQWVDSESESIEETQADPQAKQVELAKIAEKLSPQEMHYLEKKSTDMTSTARQRIFSTYLLTLAPENTHQALEEILRAPPAYAGQQPVHSPEETLAMQERSLRRMALDALIKRVRNNPQALPELRDFVSQISDDTLRKYAERNLSGL